MTETTNSRNVGDGVSKYSLKLKEVEEYTRRVWDAEKPYFAKPRPGQPKRFVTMPYPYMNASLHVGHAFTASRVDAYARYSRQKGFNVLFPFAWHWTGEPIVGISKRVTEGDPSLIKTLTELDGVPPSELHNFKDPYYIASYFTSTGRAALKRLGASVDWSREFATAHNPAYSAFIEWQYFSLREKGYVVQGTHPVVWCPRDKSPTGDHDRSQGEGVSPDQMYLVKFVLDPSKEGKRDADLSGVFLVAATYRPETIFGATNLWVNADKQYVLAEVDSERWIVSEYCANVLAEQRRSVRVLKKMPGLTLVGLTASQPFAKTPLPVLPASFVDPTFGTGVVYSVPAHAPYDYLGLVELQTKAEAELRKIGLDPVVVKGIKPVSIIEVEGHGDYPAIEEVQRLGIHGVSESAAEKATSNVYKLEYNKGELKTNCTGFEGMKVSLAKQAVYEKLREMKLADIYLELPQPVVCRCGTRCVVKILENQWFLKYSDTNWKNRVLRELAQMDVYPQDSRKMYEDTVAWLQDKACVRRSGMGTPLPWDREWIVETLSDSTVYMAYYTIAPYVASGRISANQMKKEFFDHVFYGVGDPSEVSKKTGVDPLLLEEIRSEFLYWYPVDLRNSAKELIPNHLTFFLFHHCALFDERHWPKAVSVNGMVTVNGGVMHKRLGNFVPLSKALEDYGADVTRCALLGGSENLDDPDWNTTVVRSVTENLYAFVELVERASKEGDYIFAEQRLGEWVYARLKRRASEVSSNLEVMRTRSALNEALYGPWDDLRRYWKRAGDTSRRVEKTYLIEWLKLIHPFAPHIAQWGYGVLGGTGLIEHQGFPDTTLSEEEQLLLVQEEYVDVVAEDLLNLIRLVQNKGSAEVAYSSELKRRVAKALVTNGSVPVKVTPDVIKLVSQEIGDKAKAAQLAQRIVKSLSEWRTQPPKLVSQLIDEEADTLIKAAPYLEKTTGLRISVCAEEESADMRRSANSAPLKPTITIS